MIEPIQGMDIEVLLDSYGCKTQNSSTLDGQNSLTLVSETDQDTESEKRRKFLERNR